MKNEDIKVLLVDTQKIKPYNRNARKNDETVQKLCEIIPKAGFNQPIVVDKNYVIVKGHARWKAAIKLGMEKIPVIISQNDDETNKLDRLADNKIQEFSKWDDDVLLTELASINIPDVDITDFGFDIDFPSTTSSPQGSYVIDPAAQGNEPHFITPPAYEPPEPDDNYITKEDIARTVPNDQPSYGAVTCPKCGTVVLYKK